MPQLSEERKRFLRAALDLRGNANFEIIRGEIERRVIEICNTFYKIGPDSELRKAQGRADALITLLQDINPEWAITELESGKKFDEKVSPNFV